MARLVFAFKADSFGSGVLVFLFGGLSIAAGVYMFASPAFGLGALTIALAIYFGVDGIVEIFASFQAKPAHGWGWVLVSGIASVFLAVLIMSSWPESASWAIGTLVGVRLLFAGFAMLFSGTFGEMASQDAIDAVKGN